MTWNIRTGGLDRGRPDRLPAIVEVINRERPDVLALQELRGFGRSPFGELAGAPHGFGGPGPRMSALAAATGLRAHLVPSVFGQPVALLARPGLPMTRRSGVRWRLHHAAAVATVPTGCPNTDARPLTVVCTHLNPFSPERRRREATWLAARYAVPTRPVVLAGDLNTLEPGEDHAGRLAALEPAYRHRHLAADGTADSRAITAFRDAGLLDLWPLAGEGDGRTAPTANARAPEFSGMRLDYVLATPPVAERVVRARVVRGGPAEYASDHYPVVVDLALDRLLPPGTE